MSKTTQSQFMDLLEIAAEEYDRDLIVDHSYSNMGRIAFLKKGTLEVLFDFEFSFQTTGMITFTRLPLGVAEIIAPQKPDEKSYFSNNELSTALQRVRNHLAQIRMADEVIELERLSS